MKRFILITLTLCTLVASLIGPSGAAHAQAEHAAIPANGGYTYAFNAGLWGWGVCVDHDTTQGMFASSQDRAVLWSLVGTKVPSLLTPVAVAVAEWIIWRIQGSDRGRGVCFAVAYNLVPAGWWAQ